MWVNKNKGVLLHISVIDRLNSVKNENFFLNIYELSGFEINTCSLAQGKLKLPQASCFLALLAEWASQ